LYFQLRDRAGFLHERQLEGKPIASLTFDLQTAAALLRLGGIHFAPNDEEKNRADDRHDYSRRMK
jgi:hypothetical protein